MYLPINFRAYILINLFILFSLTIALVYYLAGCVRCSTQVGKKTLRLLSVNISL